MSEPLWCDIRGHYCRCHDFGKRCDDFDDERYTAEKKVRDDTLERMNAEAQSDE